MWRLLKSEIKYDKIRIGIVLLFCLLCFIIIWYGVKWERNRAPMTLLIMLVATMLIAFTAELFRFEHKRDRWFVVLPVRLNRIRHLHLIYPFLAWLAILAVFFFGRIFIQDILGHEVTSPSLKQLATLNGLVLFVNAVGLLQRDLRHIFPARWQKKLIYIAWIGIYAGALLPFYIVTNFFGVFGEDTGLLVFLLQLSQSAVAINVLGIGFSILSWMTFFRWRSFI